MKHLLKEKNMETIYQSRVNIPTDNLSLRGEIVIPKGATAVIICVDTSNIGQFSKRNQYITRYLQANGLGALSVDLLPSKENENYHERLEVGLLKQRLEITPLWLGKMPYAKDSSIGYFATGIASASALLASTTRSKGFAIVCVSARPDLVTEDLPAVTSPVDSRQFRPVSLTS